MGQLYRRQSKALIQDVTVGDNLHSVERQNLCRKDECIRFILIWYLFYEMGMRIGESANKCPKYYIELKQEIGPHAFTTNDTNNESK